MGRRGGHRGELCRAAEVRGRRPWDAHRARQRGWDAWDGARRDAMADALQELRQKLDADAEKSAGRAQGGRESDGLQSAAQV